MVRQQQLVSVVGDEWDHCDDPRVDHCEFHHVHFHYSQYVAQCEDQNEGHCEYVDLHGDHHEAHHEGQHVVQNGALRVARNEAPSEGAQNVELNDVGHDVQHGRDVVRGEVVLVLDDGLDDIENEEDLCVEAAP